MLARLLKQVRQSKRLYETFEDAVVVESEGDGEEFTVTSSLESIE